MARTYKRDSRGRFAGGGGGSSRGGGRKPLQRGTNRLTRDNAGRITSVGGDGATARGGRLRTASGKQRATQTARISGGRAAGTVTRSGARRTAAAAAAKPVTSSRTSKKTVSSAEKRYKAAQSAARANAAGARDSVQSRRQANSAAAKVKRMERNRSTQSQSAPSNSPATQQRQRQADRARRAIANERRAMQRESEGPGSKASRTAAVAKRAQKIYSGKIDPKQKTAARLTRTQNQDVLRKRVAKMRDNTTAKPARRRAAVGKISEAKANRIVARIDANRPGRRAASGSVRRTQNAIRTHRKASDFTLAAAARARRSGKSITVAQSLQRAVSNAAKRRR